MFTGKIEKKLASMLIMFLYVSVCVINLIWVDARIKKKAKIRNRYNQVPHLTRDTIR